MIDFRKAIRKELDVRKMSVPALATKVKCNQMAIYNFLAGRSKMKSDLLAKILSELNISIKGR